MIAKRLFDLLLTLPALIVLAPIMVLIALWIKYDDPGRILFKQTRIGRFGKSFTLLKFRTMYEKTDPKLGKLTIGDDPRITNSGQILRRTKLDELPQLFNVVMGDMSLVGPRPEVPEYVEYWPDTDREIVLSLRPGLTDFAAIEYFDEASRLHDADDPHTTYVEEIIPIKLALYKKYIAKASMRTDLWLIYKTLQKIIGIN